MSVKERPPTRLVIHPDPYRFKDVGRTREGLQFCLTMPFTTPYDGNPGSEFLALYLFDLDGELMEAQIEDLGTHAELDLREARQLRRLWLADLGRMRFTRIAVAPFQVERFGVLFGLVPHPPGGDEDVWTVTAEPGGYVELLPPWAGRYHS